MVTRHHMPTCQTPAEYQPHIGSTRARVELDTSPTRASNPKTHLPYRDRHDITQHTEQTRPRTTHGPCQLLERPAVRHFREDWTRNERSQRSNPRIARRRVAEDRQWILLGALATLTGHGETINSKKFHSPCACGAVYVAPRPFRCTDAYHRSNRAR